MLRLTERWAEGFMAVHPGVVVEVEGGGSAAGIAALISGDADLASASRPLLAEEVASISAQTGTLGVSVRTARDALSVYLHPANPVRDLTLLQVKGLFSGRVGSWHKLGGVDQPIRLLVRPPNSGSHRLFQQLVLADEPFGQGAETLPTTEAIVNAVREDPTATGFGGLAWGPDLVHVSVDGQAPTRENIRNGRYPLARYLYLHAVAPPRGWPGRFVEYVLSPKGQAIIDEVGFVPLWDLDSRRTLSREPQG
jgi:phosphate transport system substrate-binding protein